MGRKDDRIAELKARLLEYGVDNAGLRRKVELLEADNARLKAERERSFGEQVRREVADRVQWLRDAMGLGL